MSITPSKHDDFVDAMVYGRRASVFIFDDLYEPPMNYKFNDYEMVRIDTKHYGFRLKNGRSNRLTNAYRCSHIEAIKRFKLRLVTQRMLG